MPDAPVRLLLVVCGDPEPSIAEAFGRYVDWFRAAFGARAALEPFDPRAEGALPDGALERYEGVVVSGSPHSVLDGHAWIEHAAALVREAVLVRAMPVLGVCFGHQLVAHACGGRVALNPRGREIGTAQVELNAAGRASALFASLPARFDVQLSHSYTVVEPPPGARVFATSALDDCQAYAFESAHCVQFHPEFTDDVIRAYLRARRAVLASEGLDADALLAAVRASDAGARIAERFAGLVAERRARPALEPLAPAALADGAQPVLDDAAR